MSFANFVIKMEADPSGVGRGTEKAINHFKKLQDQVKKTAQLRQDILKKEKSDAEAALRPEEKLNKLLQDRDLILKRLANTQSEIARKGYQQKLGAIGGQISGLQSQIAGPGLLGQLEQTALYGLLASRAPGAASLLSKGVGFLTGGAGITLAAGGALAGGIGAGIGNASDINKIALQAGISLEAAQRIKHAAAVKGGGDSEGIANSVVRLSRSQSEALNGGESQQKAFKQLGFSEHDIANLSPDQLFFEISRRVKSGKINGANINGVFELLGREARDILPYMRKGLAEVADEFDRTGRAIDRSVIQNLVKVKSVTKNQVAELKELGLSALTNVAGGTFSALRHGAIAAYSIAAPFSQGARDKVADLQASDILDNDSAYQDSLSESQSLEAKLQRKQVQKATLDAKADEEDAKDYEWYWEHGKRRKKRTGSISSGGAGALANDIDEFAKIGLFIGGGNSGFSIQSQQLRTLRDIEAEMKSLNDNLTEE